MKKVSQTSRFWVLSALAVLSAFKFSHTAKAADSCPYVQAGTSDLEVGYLNVDKLGNEYQLYLRYGVQSPKNPDGSPARIIGDVLFIHGFADRMDNHEPLFTELNRAGLRVITFDLPGHGENSGMVNSINKHSFQEMARIAGLVVDRVKPEYIDEKRPLIVSGWSTGGLLALRIAQGISPRFTKPVSGVLLFAPGVSVKMNPGDHGNVTLETLTSNPNPPHCGPIFPTSPLMVGLFPPRLIKEGLLARYSEELPKNIPTMVFAAGNDDAYVDTKGLLHWGVEQQEHRSRNSKNAPFMMIQCERSKHELDNEDDIRRGITVGSEVRRASALFAASVALGTSSELDVSSVLNQCSVK